MPIAYKICQRLHIRNMHAPPSVLRVLMRENYWTVGEASLVKRVNEDCNECSRYRNRKRFEYKENDPLPNQIDEEGTPFKTTGIDYAGPLMNLNNEKRYVLVAVCTHTKSIRLELTETLDIESTVMTLVRIRAREKELKVIISDNFKTFKAIAAKYPDWKMVAHYAPY